jgi:propanol-preferring alcohol dehydrogenase
MEEYMRGVVLLGDRECCVKDLPDPEPKAGEVRVKMMATGICGSDLHLYRMNKEQAKSRGDRVPGHEPCGIIDMIGHGVKKVKEGDRVTVYHYLGCGHCDQCASGNLMWCREARGYGGPVDGSHADYVIADERNCVPIPDSVSFIDGAFIACPGGTAFSSMKKLDVKAGNTVAVFGLGPVGLSGVAIAKAMGGKVIGIDILDLRLDLAKSIGADEIVNAKNDNPVDAIRNFTNGKGAMLAFEASGSTKGRTDIIHSLSRGGKAVFVGVGSNENVINPSQIIGSQLTLMGSFVLPLWLTWEMVGFVNSQKVSFEKAVTHRFSIDDAPLAYKIFDEGQTGKAVFEWN